MDKKDQDARNRILKATKEILDETDNIDQITVRQIAERANVGVGLINYHFKSKDNLLGTAVGDEMAKMAGGFLKTGGDPGADPVERLKTMLKELFQYGEKHKEFLKFTVTHSILKGDMQAQLTLVPLLRDIFGDQKDEIDLRIIAMQILLPLQVTALSPQAFHFYSGIDLFDETLRNKFIDTLIDNLIKTGACL
jgi:AcrR family transcriptional regulator